MFTVYKYFFIGLLVIFSLIIEANPPFKRHLAPIPGEPSFDPCVTTGLYDSNTAVTFFGDSRIDYVSDLIYGAASLDYYLTTNGTWNVQNFGVGGMDSYGLRDQLRKCFERDTSDPAKANNPNFKTAYNVAFEIGGNDYVNRIPFFILNPALYITRVPESRDNIASIIYTLQMREKNVLLIGNYPALAWSARLGDPMSYAGYNGFNPKVLKAYSTTDRGSLLGEDNEKFLKQVIKKIIIGSIFMPDALSVIGSSIGSSLSGQEDSDLNSAYQDALHAVGQDAGGQENKDLARMSIGSYSWWTTISFKAIATVPSVGVVLLENEIRAMVANPSAFGLKPFQYVSTAEVFLYPPAQYEPWVVNPNLMTDVVHKNHLGYTIWGKLVGDKIREMGWQNEKAVDDSISSNKINYQLSKTLLTNIVLFAPILVAMMLIRGKKIGWYLFLIYSILLIFQNIYSLVVVPGLLNSGVLFRTVFWISLVIYFCKKDISAPYFKMYPRGWRGELRHPVSVEMNLNNKQMVTKDLSTTGFYVESNEFYLGLNEKVALTFPFHNEVQFTAGVVRIDTAGVGFAFRNLTKENREVLNEIIKKSKLRVE